MRTASAFRWTASGCIDLTAFWAGPFAHPIPRHHGCRRHQGRVHPTTRPDALQRHRPGDDRPVVRAGVAVPLGQPQQAGHHPGPLANPEAGTSSCKLVATADVVVENFTPRVMEQFGADLRPLSCRSAGHRVLVRMPGWGLEGPWRDRPAFASTMEQVSGMAWVTGLARRPPMLPGICDPLAGIHAAFAVLAALDQRRHTGEGQQIEMAMLDMAINIAVEQIVEWAAYGHLIGRQGNSGPTAAPQGAYPCAKPDTWVAIAVSTDAEWQALCAAMANDHLAGDETLGARRRSAGRPRPDRRGARRLVRQPHWTRPCETLRCGGSARRARRLPLRHRPGHPAPRPRLLGGPSVIPSSAPSATRGGRCDCQEALTGGTDRPRPSSANTTRRSYAQNLASATRSSTRSATPTSSATGRSAG